MTGALRAKEAPFVLTVLCGLLAWTATRAIDRATEAPTIEYDLQREWSSGKVTYSIRNLSRDKAFKQLEFIVVAKGGTLTASRRLAETVVWHAPCLEGAAEEGKIRPKAEVLMGALQVPIMRLDPGCQIDLVAKVEPPGAEIEILLSLSQGADAVRFVPASTVTRFVRYEGTVLLVLFLMWLFPIVLYALVWRGEVS
ncbi:MAG: hypothetical protein AB7O37_22830 [Vicinamibacteria bacterium]